MARKKTKTDDSLRVICALREALQKASGVLSDAFTLASDTAAVDVTHDVEAAEKAVSAALIALENHWPTVDPSGRCHGCERCGERGGN